MKTSIRMSDGIIFDGEKKIGTANHHNKYGYHPVILVKLDNGPTEYFELDTPNLVDAVLKFAEENRE